jgi:transposase InsO family protein
MEAFWGTLKAEMYYLRRFSDYDVLRSAIGDYIAFYNNGRYQDKLGGLTPVEVRALSMAV